MEITKHEYTSHVQKRALFETVRRHLVVPSPQNVRRPETAYFRLILRYCELRKKTSNWQTEMIGNYEGLSTFLQNLVNFGPQTTKIKWLIFHQPSASFRIVFIHTQLTKLESTKLPPHVRESQIWKCTSEIRCFPPLKHYMGPKTAYFRQHLPQHVRANISGNKLDIDKLKIDL